jgi:hypothetical protein
MADRKYLNVLFCALLMAPLTNLSAKDKQADDPSLEGFSVVEKNRWESMYVNPAVDWNRYRQFQLEPATVAFRKNWQRDQNRYDFDKVPDREVERIKTDLSELFGAEFTESLILKGGYELANDSGADVMRIEPHIVDLDIYAPDTRNDPGIRRQYTESSGRMTLKLNIYDSVSGELIATVSDRQNAPWRGYWQWTTSVTNYADARRIIRIWAGDFIERMDGVKVASLN